MKRAETVTVPLDVAALVVGAFLPLNPNKLRSATPDVKAAAHAFKEAVHRVEQANALRADCPQCQRDAACTRHPL